MGILPEPFKSIWVRTLRYGTYPRGEGGLFRNDPHSHGYCCLGIGADICGQLSMRVETCPERDGGASNWVSGITGTDEAGFWYGPNDELRLEVPSRAMIEKAKGFYPQVHTFTVARLLAELNDRGIAHWVLADLIEEFL